MTTDRWSDPGACIDALVWGELSPEQYRQTLAWLDEHPSYWRDCALALLEEQALAQELKSIAAADRAEWAPKANDSPRADDALERFAEPPCAESESGQDDAGTERCSGTPFGSAEHRADRPEGAEPSQPSASTAVRLRARRRVEQFSVVAASLLIGVVLGVHGPEWFRYGARAWQPPQPPAAGLAQDPTQGSGDHRSPDATARLFADQASSDAGMLGRGLQPELEHVATSRIVPIDFQTPEVLQLLKRQGWIGLETVESLMVLELEDGASAIVPVQQFRVKQNVYSY